MICIMPGGLSPLLDEQNSSANRVHLCALMSLNNLLRDYLISLEKLSSYWLFVVGRGLILRL